MKFFLDTADLDEIEEAASWGVLAGVTTNPTLYARTGGKLDDFHNHIKRICEIVDGPVSAESVAMTRDEIIRDGRELAALADNVVVKIPTMVEAVLTFPDFPAAIAEDGISQLADVVAAVNNYDFGHDVEIIAASVRSANHVTQAALMGADIATVPFAALKKCVQHPLTDRGLDAFMKDWEKVQQA